MKLMTILGTRPEIIRLSRIIPMLDKVCDHRLVHTGQNFHPRLGDLFFQELGLRSPDYLLKCQADSSLKQVGRIIAESGRVLSREKPDRLLVLGDTNSALSALSAKRLGVPVYHMEAGNRCFDDRVPEEVNRRVVDHCSDILLPYTERSRTNLLREGISSHKIFVTGNPIKEVLDYYSTDIENSRIIQKLNLVARKYFLITLHRAENVDLPDRLAKFVQSFRQLYQWYQLPIVFSLHPRTRNRLKWYHQDLNGNGIIFVSPLGLFDFVSLEKQAACVLSDSGTVQEECCLFKIPSVVIRDVTERPETIECGSSILSGCEVENILNSVSIALSSECCWEAPREYSLERVSHTIVKILLGK
jgi:UDP-N-acetylglucosamine 2-epimerase (non-hydrolysing)